MVFHTMVVVMLWQVVTLHYQSNHKHMPSTLQVEFICRKMYYHSKAGISLVVRLGNSDRKESDVFLLLSSHYQPCLTVKSDIRTLGPISESLCFPFLDIYGLSIRQHKSTVQVR